MACNVVVVGGWAMGVWGGRKEIRDETLNLPCVQRACAGLEFGVHRKMANKFCIFYYLALGKFYK